MKPDFPNVVIKNVLTEYEVDSIIQTLSKTESKSFVQSLCFNSWHVRLPSEIEAKFLKYAEELSGVKLKLLEYNISKYENIEKNGIKYHPMLWPHTDEAFKKPRVTLDYQLRSNISWPVIVDNLDSVKEYNVNDNEMITFSGTHQVHWRPKKQFEDDQFLEMIFLHFEPEDSLPLNANHIKSMRKLAGKRFLEWEKTEGPSSNDDDPKSSYYRYWDEDPGLEEIWGV